MKQYIDKADLVVRVEKLQSEIAEEKKLHEDNSMWYNGINHGFNLTKDVLNSLEVKDVEEEPVSKDYRERYKKIAQSESFKEAYDGKSISEEEPSEIDFEQELYNYFGQVKDFTLGMRIAKRFYDMGKNSQEPVSEDFEAEWKEYFKYRGDIATVNIKDLAKHFANWQKQQDQSTIELAEDHAMLAGMEKMKEQMMKDAEELVVGIDANGLACVNVDGVLPDDTVRVLVIKED